LRIELNERYTDGYISQESMGAMEPEIKAAHNLLHSGTGAGNKFLGWLDLPVNYDKTEFAAVKAAAVRIIKNSEAFVVIGIGGSYLGSRAVIEFIKSQANNEFDKETPDIYFTGNSISANALAGIIKLCEGRDFSINVISKSGTTTEPAVAFRVLREILVSRYGAEEAAKRIFVTTDKSKGTLKEFADKEGYETFVVPDDVGGRYSVLTSVGLLPIAVAGVDIDALMQGAADAREEYLNPDFSTNCCYRYAAIRNLLYRSGKKIEMLVSYDPAFTMMGEWFKQLFGESEGKDGKGIFPSSAIFSTDLHSMGQYIQQGERILFETSVVFSHAKDDVTINYDPQDTDGLNFLAGKTLSFVNQKAFEGTIMAHFDGGVPNIVLEMAKMDEYNLGWLIYFFEKACAISGYLLGVNPFDQPGVESYKNNMFALLGKQGYEGLREELEARLAKK
jgi:glucose-6-phosphate isomerase